MRSGPVVTYINYGILTGAFKRDPTLTQVNQKFLSIKDTADNFFSKDGENDRRKGTCV